MKDFVAIDFESANNECSSVCSVGIVVVKDGVIMQKWSPRHQTGRTLVTI